jgi:ketosteroid isomerase-like protein
MIGLWQNWISAFDAAVDSDDWSPLRLLLADDVTYTVSGAPFNCHLVGVDEVIAGFRKSISGFDRQFDQRWWFGVGVREFGPDVVCARAMGVYRLADKPLLHFSAHSLWRFRDGRVVAMQDCYDVCEHDVQAALAWLAEHAPHADASYC